jgi:hypothetical protein
MASGDLFQPAPGPAIAVFRVGANADDQVAVVTRHENRHESGRRIVGSPGLVPGRFH